MKHLSLLILCIFMLTSCSQKKEELPSVSVKWEMGENLPDYSYTNTFYITNTGDKPLGDNWVFYYGQLPAVPQNKADAAFVAEQICSTHYKLYPTGNYTPIEPGATIAFEFVCKGEVIKEGNAPLGGYFVFLDKDGNETGTPQTVEIGIFPFDNPNQWARGGSREIYPYGDILFDKYAEVLNDAKSEVYDIFPMPKKITPKQGTYKLTPGKEIEYTTKLKGKIALKDNYQITITPDAIEITGGSEAGIFYGIQTLKMIETNCRRANTDLPAMEIVDEPDFSYRGLMLDVCRNFTKKEDILKLLDVLATYKINKLHFHLGDDEGWRLEIPGLPELTEIGARRGHTHDELDCLFPAYGSGWDMNDPDGYGNGYYSTADFVEILKYAAERYITIIPEFDMPGHSRAAIKSMLARYHKYKDTDLAKAEEYLLTDLDDKSEYLSVQYYNDNAIDVGRPSTYTFIFKVIDEVGKMYNDAGIPFEIWNLGGDEVPHGAWEGSEYCQEMAKELGLDNIRDIEDHFVSRVAEYLKARQMKMIGWQEISLASDGKPNKDLQKYGLINYCWHNSESEAGKQTLDNLISAGFPVVLSSVDYLYMDMAYNAHQSEPGLYWGGYVDEFRSFAMDPAKYANLKSGLVLGIQAQLFRETIQGHDKVERCLFPKIFGVAERAWNIRSRISVQTYNNIINSRLIALEEAGINYRIAQPGIKIIDGKLHANCPVKEAEIYYTTDGSVPTKDSSRWTSPVDCDAMVVRAKAFYGNKESVVSLLQQQR